jgi:hypothetical protein
VEPVWLASWIFLLARDTGWSRDFILWELSYAEWLQYRHVQLRSADEWTVVATPWLPAASQLEALRAAFADETGDEI